MRKFFISFLLLAGIFANAQINALAAEKTSFTEDTETGIIQGKITTTDNQPAAYVNVSVQAINRSTYTDERGVFILKNIKPGTYTLSISMIGLQTHEQKISVVAKETTTVSFSLSENQKQLEEVIITSRRTFNDRPVSIGKMAIDPMDLPQGLAIVGAGTIREQQAQRLSDVIKNVNGVYVTTTRGNVQESFGARGYSLGSNNLFKNGSRINSAVMPEMSSLEKVEILKGSAAILYGQVAPGGIVNMVTKKSKFERGGEILYAYRKL